MPKLRQDPTTKKWVVFATERAKRPHDFIKHGFPREAEGSKATCPFCPGNEASTPLKSLFFQQAVVRLGPSESFQ